jgi:hypothetical protein
MTSHTRNRLLTSLAVAGIVVVSTYFVLLKIVNLNQYHDDVVTAIQGLTGGKVSLGHMSWGITDGIWIDVQGLTIRDANFVPGDIELPQIYAKISILPILKKKIVVQTLRFDHPTLEIKSAHPAASQKEVMKPSEHGLTDSNGELSKDHAPKAEMSSLPIELVIREAQVTQGQITLPGDFLFKGSQAHKLDEVEIKLSNLSPDQQASFSFALRDTVQQGLGALKGRGTFSGLTANLAIVDPSLDLTATLQGFAAEVIKSGIEGTPLAQGLGGTISVDLSYTGDLGQHFDTKGLVDLSKFTYSDASLWEKPLPGTKTTLGYEASFDPDRIDLARLDLAIGNISMTGRAQIENWRQQPVLRNTVLEGRTPLSELSRFIPWKLLGEDEKIVRQLLDSGGEIVVEHLGFPDLSPEQLSSDETELLKEVDATLTLSGISFKPSTLWPELTKIAGSVRLQNGELSASDIHGRLGPLTLPTLTLHATSLMDAPKITASTKGLLELKGTTDTTVEHLLMSHGLRRLSGDTTVDLQARYDVSDPTRWGLTGSLALKGISAETHPDGVILDDLQGLVSLKRANTLDIHVERLTGQINQASIEIDGKVVGVGARSMTLDGRAKAGNLNLAHFVELVPALKQYRVGGMLDMDLQINYSPDKPEDAQLAGKIQAHDLNMQWNDFHVEEGDADISLSDKGIEVKKLAIRLNDQKIHLSGQLSGIHEPQGEFHLQSSDLNIDRLLGSIASDVPPVEVPVPTKKPEQPVSSAAQRDGATGSDAGEVRLPAFLLESTVNGVIQIDKLQFREQTFQGLQFDAQYQRGAITQHKLDVEFSDGKMSSQGSIDFTDLARVSFDIEPNINTVPLEPLSHLLGFEVPVLHGPFTLSGKIRGHTGSSEEVMTSLSGTLAAEIGPGQIQSETTLGDTLFNLLSAIHIKGILSGQKRGSFAAGGIPYKSLNLKAAFGEGKMEIQNLALVTTALNVDSTGTADLVNQRLKVRAEVAVLKNADMVLGFVPLVGDIASDMIKVYLEIEGPADKLEISVLPAAGLLKGVEEGVEKGVEKVDEVIKGIFHHRPHVHDGEKTE